MAGIVSSVVSVVCPCRLVDSCWIGRLLQFLRLIVVSVVVVGTVVWLLLRLTVNERPLVGDRLGPRFRRRVRNVILFGVGCYGLCGVFCYVSWLVAGLSRLVSICSSAAPLSLPLFLMISIPVGMMLKLSGLKTGLGLCVKVRFWVLTYGGDAVLALSRKGCPLPVPVEGL